MHCVLRLLQFGRTRCVCVLARNILAPVYLGFVCFVREQLILLCDCSFTCVSVEKKIEWLGNFVVLFRMRVRFKCQQQNGKMHVTGNLNW